MKLSLLIITLLTLCVNAHSQIISKTQLEFIGKWKLVKSAAVKGQYFDLENIDSTYKKYLINREITRNNTQISDPHYSNVIEDDSSTIKNDFEDAMKGFQKLFIEIHNNNTYTTNDSTTADTTFLIVQQFKYNTKTNVFSTLENGKISFEEYLLIEDGLLIRVPISNDKSIPVRTYRRVK